MKKIVGYIAGVLILASVVVSYIPIIPLETKMVMLTYLCLILTLFAGAAGIMLLQQLIVRLVIGVLTIVLITRMITYLPDIISRILSG